MPAKKRKGHPPSEHAKQIARETALRLVQEGRFGGRGPRDGSASDGEKTWGQGGKPRPKFVPKAEQLLALLEAVDEARGQHESGVPRRIARHVPRACLTRQRERMQQLLAHSLAVALERHLLPQKAVLDKQGTVRLYWQAREQRRPIESGDTVVQLLEPIASDFASYRPEQLLEMLVLISDPHAYPTQGSREVLDWLLGFANEIADAASAVLTARGGAQRVATEA